MNNTLLQLEIRKNLDTQQTLADVIGINRATLCQKINGHRDFTASEIKTIIARYNLSPKETNAIFFAE